MSGRCLVGAGGVLRASCLAVSGCADFFRRIVRTGQNRTFQDIVGLGGLGRGFGREGERIDHESPFFWFVRAGVPP